MEYAFERRAVPARPRFRRRAVVLRPLFASCLLFAVGCGDSDDVEPGEVVILTNDVLVAHFADNGPLPDYDDHLEGLHGIVRLRHASRPNRDLFIQSQSGLNYETSSLRGVVDQTWEEIAEPRYSSMEIRRLDETSVELYQPATERKEIEASLTYTLVEDPAAVDFEFTFVLHKSPQPNGSEPDFQTIIASYMYDPEDPTLYFMGHTPGDPVERWLRANADYHGSFWVEEADGSVRQAVYFVDRPYFAGTVDEFLIVFMIDPPEVFGLWYSPNGGWDRDFSSPAWDLNLAFHDIPGPPYEARVRGRLLVLPEGVLSDVEANYRSWAQSFEGENPPF